MRYVEKVHESIALNDLREPCVIISASGMCEAGRILHHLKHNIEDPRSTILIAGYQAPDTLGRRLVERRPEVRILGRTLALKAEVVVLNGLSSHADHGGCWRASLRWQDRAPGTVGAWRAGARGGAGRWTAGGWLRGRGDSGTRRKGIFLSEPRTQRSGVSDPPGQRWLLVP